MVAAILLPLAAQTPTARTSEWPFVSDRFGQAYGLVDRGWIGDGMIALGGPDLSGGRECP